MASRGPTSPPRSTRSWRPLQFEIESKDLVRAALDDFRRSAADFSDCLIGRRKRGAGALETVTLDRSLKGLEGLRLHAGR